MSENLTKEKEEPKKEWYEKVKVPNSYFVMAAILFAVFILTHLIPAGTYERVQDPVTGRTLAVQGTYQEVDVKAPSVFDLFISIQEGYVDAADITYMIIFAYTFVFFLTKNGTMDATLNSLVKLAGKRVWLIIPIMMYILGFISSCLGIFEEVYGLYPVLVGMFVALGYDALVGGAIIYVGCCVGFTSGMFNPYNTGIAHELIGLPMYSGLWFRVIIFVVFQTVAVIYVMRYARKVKLDPTKSLLYGVQMDDIRTVDLSNVKMTGRQKICVLIFAITLGMMLYGTVKLGWYLTELSALFFMAILAVGIASGYKPKEILATFIESIRSIIGTMMIVGFTRGIMILMEKGCIADTIVFYLVSFLENTSKYVTAYGMLIIQNVITFFVGGSFSQATVTMPIMGPTAELLGINKQIAVLAYLFGNGYSDLIWPTTGAVCCGMMNNLPLSKWYKFILPLFGILLVMEFVFLTIAMVIGYT